MKNILVTGGTGFIGSHTCVELMKQNYVPVVMDNFSNSKQSTISSIKQITGKLFPFYHADMLDYKSLTRIFDEFHIDAVIHFAGYKAVGESVEKPLEYYENNITGTLNVLKAMKEFGCKNIIFSSSATVYGMYNTVPYNETMPTSATNPYGYTKVMIEQIIKDYSNSDKDFSAVLLRYFNPIGAHPSGLIGEDPNGIPNNLLPYICKVAVGKLSQLNIFGNDYDTPDGTGVRDYIHVVDLAKGHIKALDYSLSHKGTEIFNLGTGKGSSVLEVLKSFEKACGKEIPYKIAPRRNGDIATCYADTKKASEILHWNAELSLDEMTESSWNFVNTNK